VWGTRSAHRRGRVRRATPACTDRAGWACPSCAGGRAELLQAGRERPIKGREPRTAQQSGVSRPVRAIIPHALGSGAIATTPATYSAPKGRRVGSSTPLRGVRNREPTSQPCVQRKRVSEKFYARTTRSSISRIAGRSIIASDV